MQRHPRTVQQDALTVDDLLQVLALVRDPDRLPQQRQLVLGHHVLVRDALHRAFPADPVPFGARGFEFGPPSVSASVYVYA